MPIADHQSGYPSWSRTNQKEWVSWKEAISRFKDSTGRPGPSTWEVGTYPEGQGDFPVCGVSWYEAEAFARYAEKELPTLYHWIKAAGLDSVSLIVPSSNFSNKGLEIVWKIYPTINSFFTIFRNS